MYVPVEKENNYKYKTKTLRKLKLQCLTLHRTAKEVNAIQELVELVTKQKTNSLFR